MIFLDDVRVVEIAQLVRAIEVQQQRAVAERKVTGHRLTLGGTRMNADGTDRTRLPRDLFGGKITQKHLTLIWLKNQTRCNALASALHLVFDCHPFHYTQITFTDPCSFLNSGSPVTTSALR
ncbi:MAG TPA: hypothetical protein VF429_04425, partial [Anaerolineae bacterium]